MSVRNRDASSESRRSASGRSTSCGMMITASGKSSSLLLAVFPLILVRLRWLDSIATRRPDQVGAQRDRPGGHDRGATSTAGVIAHLRYIDRNGRLEVETDEGDHLKEKASRRISPATGISTQRMHKAGGRTAARRVASRPGSFTTLSSRCRRGPAREPGLCTGAVRPQASLCPGGRRYAASALRTCSGSRAMAVSNAFAGPVG